MALRTSSLILESEQREKDCSRFSEAFDLRGEEINKLHQDALEKSREKQTSKAI